MITLLDLAHWVDRLKAECPIFGGRVFQAIPDDELSIDQHESPVAFIYLAGDKSEESKLINRTRQRMFSGVAIELAVRRTATQTDKFNEAASITIRLARTEIFTALIGWQPPDAASPVEHIAGELKKEKKALRWADTFNTDNYLFK
jgi:hypothetical protein